MGYSLKNHHEICGNFINKAKKTRLIRMDSAKDFQRGFIFK